MRVGFTRDLGLGLELVIIDAVHPIHCHGLAGGLGVSAWGLRFKNNYFTEMCSVSEAGSYLRLIDLCITQL